MPDIEFNWYLCRHTRDGSLMLLGSSEINEPVLAQLSCDDADRLAPLTIGGDRWFAHDIEFFGDPDDEWRGLVFSEMAKEINRLEREGVLK